MTRFTLKIAGLITLLSLALPHLAAAQTTGTCEVGKATTDLDVNNVRARLYNAGNLFWNGGGNVYNVPKASPGQPITPNAIFSTSFWIGGRVNDELRLVTPHYGDWEFWPGPLDEDGLPPADCSAYDRIYSIYRDDILHYNQTGEATDDLAEWPWELGAPVLDGDGNPDNYDLEAGDRPALIGDQIAWWVMNDVGNTHKASQTPPIGLEVQVTAFAFDVPGNFGNTTFYRYRLHYRGTEPLEEAWLGFYADTDLGNASDDYMATDTTLGMVYTYNADDLDEGSDGYGIPPALGFSFVQGLQMETDGEDNDSDGLTDEADEQLGMTRSFGTNPDLFHPGRPAYEALRGIWSWQNEYIPMCFGGIGHPNLREDVPCTGTSHFLYSGDPVTESYWSEFNIDNAGMPNVANDRTLIISSGPFEMEPDDEQEFVLAIVWARGTDHLDSVSELRNAMRSVQRGFPSLNTPDSTLSQRPEPELPATNAYTRNYPNPFTETTTIHYELANPAPVRLAVYDVLGREVATLVDKAQEVGFYDVEFDGRNLPVGVYVYRLQVGTTVTSETMIHMH
ncbi:MAG TPA: T9SS type A sorting domain-containing protein [Rhodothermales bacterium]|nr:T9SS type A sorting domain-containing protein [Rhodothermales bacterium]